MAASTGNRNRRLKPQVAITPEWTPLTGIVILESVSAMEYCLASAEKIPFSDESFDVVFGDFSTKEPLLRDHHIPGSARRAIRCGRQQNGHNQP
jgi:hypothetical protein